MSQIVVRRAKAAWQDRGRDYRVLVNGKESARVANGSSVKIAVQPGAYSVQLKIDWCQSKEIRVSAEAGTNVQLECGPNATPLLALLYITFLRKSYIWLHPAQGGDSNQSFEADGSAAAQLKR